MKQKFAQRAGSSKCQTCCAKVKNPLKGVLNLAYNTNIGK